MLNYLCRFKHFLLCSAFSLAFLSPAAGEEFAFDPPKKFNLVSAYVGMHYPVSTDNKTAQLYFDQGFTFLYAFNHEAAYWSFLKASELDSNMAMAYWGMALALGRNINMETTPERRKLAYASIQTALKLAAQATEAERDFIQALAQRYAFGEQLDETKLSERYSQAMRALTKKYPEDLDAAALFAESLLDIHPWHQWSQKGKPLDRTLEAVNALESVLKRDPMHLGANHYHIHAIEASPHPERALMSAQRLRTLLPSSGHILHMPSHIYFLVGDYHLVAQCNEEAIAADKAFIQRYGMEGYYPLDYLSHNMYFLTRAYDMEGRFESAWNAAVDLETFYEPYFKRMPDLEFYLSAPMLVLVHFHKWDEVLKVHQIEGDRPLTAALWHFGRTLAWINLEDNVRASQERDLFLQAKAKVAPELSFGASKASTILELAATLISAKMAESQNKIPAALELWRRAVAQQDALPYSEPPDWFFPVRESLGAFLLKVKDYQAAVTVFTESLERTPRSGRALFGLSKALKGLSKMHDYYWVNREFQIAWKYSDVQL